MCRSKLEPPEAILDATQQVDCEDALGANTSFACVVGQTAREGQKG